VLRGRALSAPYRYLATNPSAEVTMILVIRRASPPFRGKRLVSFAPAKVRII